MNIFDVNSKVASCYALVVTPWPIAHIGLDSLMHLKMFAKRVLRFEHFVTIRPNAGNRVLIGVALTVAFEPFLAIAVVVTSGPIAVQSDRRMALNVLSQRVSGSERFGAVIVSAPVFRFIRVAVDVMFDTALELESTTAAVYRTDERPLFRVLHLMNRKQWFVWGLELTFRVIADILLFFGVIEILVCFQ